MEGDFDGFSAMANHAVWPGAWSFGVDFSGGSQRIIAVHVGNEAKYSAWKGPIPLTKKTAIHLEVWAEQILLEYGGYVNLFPADGDATQELINPEVADEDDEEEQQQQEEVA